MNRFIWICFFCCLQVSVLKGQNWDYGYTHLGKEEGLPSNKVYFMTNDRNGVLWFGTDAGLCRYDGSHLKVFTKEDGLPSNDVFELFCDSKNRIWITTMSNELCYFYHDKIHTREDSKILKEIPENRQVSRVVEDKNHIVWVVLQPLVFCQVVQDDVKKSFNYNEIYGCAYRVNATSQGLSIISDYSLFYNELIEEFQFSSHRPTIPIFDIIQYNDSSWIYTDTLNRIQYIKSKITDLPFMAKNRVMTLFKTDEFIYQLSKRGVIESELYSLRYSHLLLRNDCVSNFLFDKFKNCWISTLNDGIFKINNNKVRVFEPFNKISQNSIHSILVDSTKTLFGNSNGVIGFLKARNEENSKNIDLNLNSVLSYRILKLLEKNNELYICTDIGTYSYHLKSHTLREVLTHQACKNMFFLHDTLLVLTNVGVYYLNLNGKILKEERLNKRFFSFADFRGERIFGSENMLYIEKDSLVPYMHDTTFHHRMMDLLSLDSVLVLSTTEKGVFFIYRGVAIHNLNMSNGLSSNNCSRLAVHKDLIYVATNNGICRFRSDGSHVERIMETEGLASNNILDLYIYKDTLYAGTDKGLSVLPIANIHPKTTFAFFLSPVTNGHDTLWDQVRSINSHTDWPVKLTMNALSLGIPGEVIYYYKMRDGDSVYTITFDPNVTLRLTKPGTYYFEAFGIDPYGVHSETATLQINIVPYWHETRLFYFIKMGIYFCIFIITCVFIYFLIKRQEKIRNEMRARGLKLELDAWKSNINPHFLFNSFNTLQSLFNMEDYESANHYIAHLAMLLRITIDNSSRLMIPIKDEIEYLKSYIALENIKRHSPLRYEITYNREEVLRYFIPSLILQPLVENAMKHGLFNTDDDRLYITFTLRREDIEIRVRDNGRGVDFARLIRSNSLGLRMIKDKIRIVEGLTMMAFDFEMYNLEDKVPPENGTETVIVMPLFQTDFQEVFAPNQHKMKRMLEEDDNEPNYPNKDEPFSI